MVGLAGAIKDLYYAQGEKIIEKVTIVWRQAFKFPSCGLFSLNRDCRSQTTMYPHTGQTNHCCLVSRQKGKGSD